MKASPNRFVSANLPVNKFKNRLVNILPCKCCSRPHEETNNLCFRPGLTQIELCSHRNMLESGNFGFKYYPCIEKQRR